MTREFLNDHAMLRRMMVDIAHLIESDDADLSALTRIRIEFSRLFHVHVATERSFISAHCDGSTFKTYDSRMRELTADYSAYVNAWTPPAIFADQQGYYSKTRALQQRLLAMMEWEERTVFTGNLRSAAA